AKEWKAKKQKTKPIKMAPRDVNRLLNLKLPLKSYYFRRYSPNYLSYPAIVLTLILPPKIKMPDAKWDPKLTLSTWGITKRGSENARRVLDFSSAVSESPLFPVNLGWLVAGCGCRWFRRPAAPTTASTSAAGAWDVDVDGNSDLVPDAPTTSSIVVARDGNSVCSGRRGAAIRYD